MRRVDRSPAVANSRTAALFVALALPVLTMLAACNRAPSEPGALKEIRLRGELRVVTINNPTTYYLGTHGAEGLEFGLAQAFSKKLGIPLVITPVSDLAEMRSWLETGQADIAAAQLTADEALLKVGDAAQPYEEVEQLVVYKRGENRPKGTLQLESARLAVRAASPQERVLQKLKGTVAPTIEWVATAPVSADPLDDVESGQAKYAIVDAREYSFARHLYPNVAIGFTLPATRPAQWIVRKNAPDLLKAVNEFFDEVAQSGLLAQLSSEATGDDRDFDYLESRNFQAHIAVRLGAFRQFFEDASEKSGVDWRLLAAIGYQESKWDPKAESQDGALGVMMLTQDTATAMGITDRKNAQQNIFAGARYFAEVKEKIPERIAEPDRTWLAVASYNVGFGHLEDARVLAQSRGKNPDSWEDVRECLPLLAQERYYAKAKRGYARGWEPAQFVDRVQRFLTLLEWAPTEAIAHGTRVDIKPEA
jgi:membrane-bound lytic murein transglycosylase F